MASASAKRKTATVCNTQLVRIRHVHAISGNSETQHYTNSYKFAPAVGTNEGSEKTSSGAGGNNRELQTQMPKPSQPRFVTLSW